MTNEPDTLQETPDQAPKTTPLALLKNLRWLLVIAILLFIFFWLTGSLAGPQAVVGMAVMAATAFVAPRNKVGENASEQTSALANTDQQQAWAQLTNALPDPCVLLDGRAVVVHCNTLAEKEFPNIGIGNPLAFSLRNPTLLSAVETVRSGGQAMSIEINQSVPSEVWFRVHVAPLEMSSQSDKNFVVVTLQNLTEQKRIDAMRADFVANASHELRTPLTSLVGFIETLQGPAAGDKTAREKFLSIMATQAQRMSNLIDDLLSLSRIEQRQHVRPTDNVDLSLILSEVIEGLQNQASEANVDIKLTLPEQRVQVPGDREELYEVVQNLVDNAVKYGAVGEQVLVDLKPVDQPGYAYQVSVVDFGAGIAEEHVPRLTERFYRVDAESSRKKKGTGLGLAIVKHIINRHAGALNIRSALGEGTRVEVLLPGSSKTT